MGRVLSRQKGRAWGEPLRLVFGDREERCKGGGIVGVGRRLGDAVVAGETGGADAVGLGMEVVADGGEERGHGLGRRRGPARPTRRAWPSSQESGMAQSISRIRVVQRSAAKSRSRSKFAGSRHIASRSVPMCSKISRMSARRWRVRFASEVSIPPRSGSAAPSSSKMYSTAGRFDWKLRASIRRRATCHFLQVTIISSRSRPSVAPSSQKRGASVAPCGPAR